MKLLYITVSMPFGPGEEFFIPEVCELLRQGHEILIVPRSPVGAIVNQDAAGLRRHSLRRHLLSPSVLFAAALELTRHPITAIRTFALLFRNSTLIVSLKNIMVFPKGLWLARVARKWNADHIHAQWGLTTATIAMVASEQTGIPWSFTAHRGDIAEPNLLETKTAKAAFARYISQSGLRMAEGLNPLAGQRKACVIHMGVALPVLPSMQAKSNGPFTLLCPADLYPVKGHRYLIQAMAILQNHGIDCILLLAGDGGLRKELQAQVEGIGLLTAVEFLNHVPHQQVLKWYRDRQIDVVVLPSIDLGNNLHEGMPVSLMEAMAYSIPVVSTTTGGIPELLHDSAGIMVRAEDSEALATAIKSLISDPALRLELAAAGRRRIEEDFAIKETVTALAMRMAATVT